MRVILICPQETLRKDFEAVTAEFKSLVIYKTLTEFPAPDALRRLVRSSTPDLIFLSMEDMEVAESVNNLLAADFPRVPRIGLHSSQQPAAFRHALRLGVRELFTAPFNRTEIGEALGHMKAHLEQNPASIGRTDHFFSFMPAKAGVGASMIAANVSWALGEMEGQRTLLADFDQHSGVTGFLFNADNDFTLSDPAVRAKQLDDEAWGRLVTKAGKVDLLLSGAPFAGELIQPSQVSDIVEFARRNYTVVNADLPDTLDETTLAVLQDSRQIFLVTTSELPALRLAKLKTMLLRKLDLESKLSLVVNRVAKNMELTHDEIEKTVGLPVFATFPSDYVDVTKSLRAGKPSRRLVASSEAFVEKAMNAKTEAKKKSRFIERFSVVPMRYGFQ